jgi:hypothetical protein
VYLTSTRLSRIALGAAPYQTARVLERPIPARGRPALDLIDFDFPRFHRRCADLSAVSKRRIDAVGETVYGLLLRL